MIRKLFFTSLMLLVSIGLYAQTAPNRMLVHLSDGATVSYPVDDVSQVDFFQMQGDPQVEWHIDNLQPQQLTMTFTPNADVAGFSVCLFDAGTLADQFRQWSAFMGFQTQGDMVRRWGREQTGTYTNTWTNLEPGKAYEVYIQCWDAVGNDANLVAAPATTPRLGGKGTSVMTIDIGEFGGDAENGYYQWVTYIPNDETNLHRDIIITREAYESPEWGETGVLEYLKEDQPYNTYWNQYGVDAAQWSAEPQTEYIAFSLGQNANGEWGELARKDFTTPNQ